ncbi:unnamed protein product [Brassica oleracea]
MGGSMGFLGKGVPPTQMMNMVMGSLYKQFTEKAINNFDDFHVAVLDIFKPTLRFSDPGRIKGKKLFPRPKSRKEEKKKVFIEMILKKVKQSKLDDVTMITGIVVSPPAAMAAKRAGENIPQLKLIKLIPDENVFEVIYLLSNLNMGF